MSEPTPVHEVKGARNATSCSRSKHLRGLTTTIWRVVWEKPGIGASVLPSDIAIHWEKQVTKRVTALLRRRWPTGVVLSSLRPPRVAMWHHLLCVIGSLPHLLECVPGTIAFPLLVNCLQNLQQSNTLGEGKIFGHFRESAANSRTGVDMNLIARPKRCLSSLDFQPSLFS